MAQVDSRIAMGVQPLDVGASIGRGYQLRDLAAQADARGLDAQAKQLALKKQTTIGEFHKQYTAGGKLDRAAFSQRVVDEGYGADLAGMQKQWGDNDKDEQEYWAKNVDRTIKTLEYSNKAIASLLGDPGVTPEKVRGVMHHMVAMDLMGANQGAQAAREIPDDPQEIRMYLEQKLAQSLPAEQAAKLFQQDIQAQNLGGHTQMVDMNPRTNPGIVGQRLDRSATMGEQESARHNRAAEGLTARGQSMVDARSRESNAAAMSKPFEVTGEDGKPMLVQQDKAGNIRPVQGYSPKAGADKPLTDSQSKALLFGSRMQEADKVLQALEQSGTTTSIPGSRAGGGVGAAINFFSPAQQQQLNQAKRDYLNAVLRRESGAVIADSEIDNGDKQYFPQPGDSREVIAQKARNRKNATSLILREVPEKQRGESGGGTSAAPGGSPTASGKSAAPSIDALLKKYE